MCMVQDSMCECEATLIGHIDLTVSDKWHCVDREGEKQEWCSIIVHEIMCTQAFRRVIFGDLIC